MAQFNQVVQCIPTVGKKYLVCGFTCLCVLLNLYIFVNLPRIDLLEKIIALLVFYELEYCMVDRFNQGVQRMSDLELELVVTDSTNI